MKKRILIIGGGLSGLASAIRLAAEGHQVAILEQNKRVGGQINRITKNEFTIDLDMKILTMPETFTDLFACAGKKVEDYLSFHPIEPQWRTFFSDGQNIDFTSNSLEWSKHLSSAKLFQEYLDLCRQLYLSVLKKINPQSDSWLRRIKQSFERNPKQTLREIHQQFLQKPHLEQMFNFFSLFEGQTPEQASVPLILHNIYSQLNSGLYTIQGGSYHLIEVLVQLLYELGVEIYTDSTVSKILIDCFEVVGVELADGTQLPADIILSSLDPHTTYQKMLGHYSNQSKLINTLPTAEPTLSGHMLILYVNHVYGHLAQQNIFFSAHPIRELDELFVQKKPAKDPTLVVNIPHVQPNTTSTGKQILIVFSHVPALKEGETWDAYRKPFYTAYRRTVITKLEQMGLDTLERNLIWEIELTPEELQKQLGSTGGCLYGVQPTPPKKLMTNLPYKSKGIHSLYFIGNSVSYGNSIPLILFASKYITQQIKREIEQS